MKAIALAASVALGLLLAGPGLRAQSPAFDVASIKPSPPAPDPIAGYPLVLPRPDGGVRTTNTALVDLVRFAYDVEPDQVVGASGWQTSARFDIDARAREGEPTGDALTRERLKTLLADRFKLQARVEARETSVSALVLASRDGQFGPNLKRSTTDCTPTPSPCRTFVGPPPGYKPGTPPQMTIRGVGVPLSALAKTVGQSIGARVVDRTGLTGLYDFETELVVDPQAMLRQLQQTGVALPGDAAQRLRDAAGDTPSMSSVLQQRLGLKLEAQKTPVPFIVIESAERPAAD